MIGREVHGLDFSAGHSGFDGTNGGCQAAASVTMAAG